MSRRRRHESVTSPVAAFISSHAMFAPVIFVPLTFNKRMPTLRPASKQVQKGRQLWCSAMYCLEYCMSAIKCRMAFQRWPCETDLNCGPTVRLPVQCFVDVSMNSPLECVCKKASSTARTRPASWYTRTVLGTKYNAWVRRLARAVFLQGHGQVGTDTDRMFI